MPESVRAALEHDGSAAFELVQQVCAPYGYGRRGAGATTWADLEPSVRQQWRVIEARLRAEGWAPDA